MNIRVSYARWRILLLAVAVAIIALSRWRSFLPEETSARVQTDESFDPTEKEWTVVRCAIITEVAQDIWLVDAEKTETGFMLRQSHKQFEEMKKLKVGDVLVLHRTKETMDVDPGTEKIRFEIKARRAPPC
jgi:hypothetical protein